MTRNDALEDAIIYVLADAPGPELPRDEIVVRVQERAPDACWGDWEKATDGALQHLRDKGLVSSRPIPGYAVRYYWRLAPGGPSGPIPPPIDWSNL